MDEYIKREAALALVKPDAPEDEKAAVTIATAKKLVRSIVCRTPAADVAPVVRCKDCKYWQGNNDDYPHEECRWWHEETPDADDFCSYGERREE
mgnify:CR=1 FL=1|jgi:hypothetical protein|nr:MAG TPA: hypothetical protein [Caudoviricetes sp.]